MRRTSYIYNENTEKSHTIFKKTMTMWIYDLQPYVQLNEVNLEVIPQNPQKYMKFVENKEVPL